MRTSVRVVILTVVIFGVHTTMLGWSILTALSALLTAITLVLVRDGIAAPARYIAFLTTAWLYWGLSYISNLVEAVYFSVIFTKVAVSGTLTGLMMALLTAGVLEALTTPGKQEPPRFVALTPGLWWRVPLLAVSFFVIYLAAGAAIYPWVASFYAHQHLPTLPQLLRLQFCRGLFDLACIYPVFRHWRQSRKRAVWASVCVFTVLCGWAPLLLPNQYMPGRIRLAHGMEMGASGVLFGLIAAIGLLKPVQNALYKEASDSPRGLAQIG